MLEKKTTKEIIKENLISANVNRFNAITNYHFNKNLNKVWVSQESLVKFILSNYTIERRGGQGITNKNRPKRLIDIELLFKELKGEKE